MSHKSVIIATFNYAHELQVLRSILQSQGVKCFILDENIINTDPLVTFAVGGVKLAVLEKDLRKALVIKEKYEYRKNDLNEEEIDGEYLELKFLANQQSSNTQYRKKYWSSAIAIVLVFVILSLLVAYFIS